MAAARRVGQVGREQPGPEQQHDAGGAAQQRAAAAHALESGERALPEEREGEERQRRARGVGDGDDHEAARDVILRGERGHGRQDRPGAGRPDDRQRGTEGDAGEEAVAGRERAARPRGDRLEEAAGPLGERRHEQHEPREGEQDDRDRVQQILRQPERGEHARRGQRECDERHREAQGDSQRTAAAARRRRREDDRDDGQRAGREERRQARDDRGEDQGDAHGPMLGAAWARTPLAHRQIRGLFRFGTAIR